MSARASSNLLMNVHFPSTREKKNVTSVFDSFVDMWLSGILLHIGLVILQYVVSV